MARRLALLVLFANCMPSLIATTPAPATDAARALARWCPECEGIPVYADPDARVAYITHWMGIGATVYFNPVHMDDLRETYGDTLPFAIFAHEFGHYIDGSFGDAWEREQAADAWAGCALAVAGYPLDPFERALAQRIATTPTLTHPPADLRISAVRHGHEWCSLEIRSP